MGTATALISTHEHAGTFDLQPHLMNHEHASPSKSPNSPPPHLFTQGNITSEQFTSDSRVNGPASSSSAPKAKINKFLKYARREKNDFPPSSWFGKVQETAPITASLPATPIINDEIREAGSSAADDVIPLDSREERLESELPEPDTLARRIQAMIVSLPSLPSGLSTTPHQLHPTLTGPSAIDTDDDAPPTTSLEYSITDSKLKTFLTSFTIMNGSVERGRESVWSILDRLRSPLNKKDVVSEPNEASRPGAEYEDDNGSVMMYGPLEPTEDSEIEIAHSEIVSLNGDGEEIRTPQLKFVPLPSESIEQVFAQNENSDRRKGKQRAAPEQIPSSSRVQTEGMTAGVSVMREYRVWLPSVTKISIQAMWWGFRIYLPPPVLDALNDKQLEAAKRAAVITTALKWLLDHLPISLMPPQLRTPMSFLRRLAPYLGYIGGFIAWSWSALKVFDKGYGVVLTATWLLPIALIPGTWEASDFPTLQAEPQTPAWSK